MEIQHLEKSGFRRLNLVDCSTPDGDCNCDGGWWDNSYPLLKLFLQSTDLIKTNPRLMAALGGDEEKEEVKVGQLLAQPSIVLLIDNFIASYGEQSVASTKKKDATVSAEYRTRGNDDYASGLLSQAAYYYTLAIVYAPDVVVNSCSGPDALALAYGNRSAVLFQLGKFEACLADIEHAYAAGCPPAKWPKLLVRKVECLISLARHREANDAWRELITCAACMMCNTPGVISIETCDRIRNIQFRLRPYTTTDDDDKNDKVVANKKIEVHRTWMDYLKSQIEKKCPSLDVCNYFKVIYEAVIEPVMLYAERSWHNALKRKWEIIYKVEVSETLSFDSDSEASSSDAQTLPSNFKESSFKFQASSSSATNQLLPIINYLSRTGRYEPSTKLPSLSAKLEPTRSTTAKGAHRLVANQNIESGTILVVESPFVSVLDRKFEFHFCHHCARRLEVKIGDVDPAYKELCIGGSSVPCTRCTRVLYCSTDCRAQSWRQYHQFECSILPVLYEMTTFGHLALRILLVTGLDVASRVITRNVGQEQREQMPEYSDPTDIEANYETFHRLALPERESPPPELALFRLASAVMVQLLKKCQFVRTDEEAKLAGTIVQRHFTQVYVKSHPISSRISTAEHSPAAVQVGESAFTIGRAIYPYLASGWRHSCHPNTKHTYVDSSLVLYRATRCISAGTEMTIRLGTTFVEQNWPERQEALWKQYGFRCDCAKCVLEARDGLDGKYFPIGCKDCGCTLTRTCSTSATFNCSSPTCSIVTPLSTVSQLYAQVELHLSIVNQLCGNGIITSPISADQFVEPERHLAQLSAIKGMDNYHKLSLLNYLLVCLLGLNGCRNMAKLRQYYERYVDIFEHNNGCCDAFYLLAINKVDFYRNEAIMAANGRVGDRIRFSQCYPRAMKRAAELARIFSLADAQDEATAPALLVEESRYPWMVEQTFVKRLKEFE